MSSGRVAPGDRRGWAVGGRASVEPGRGATPARRRGAGRDARPAAGTRVDRRGRAAGGGVGGGAGASGRAADRRWGRATGGGGQSRGSVGEMRGGVYVREGEFKGGSEKKE
ncbi:hypothetical protein GUJ93_ZPchr0006g41720 [Zizania palustris]|uniref:Uncharacterized protein n=1 Tax=Zizania palustris TaxID=103762 RepID=A0A8J5VJC2_ZIZPA|nr:hypothetical protein GUJ93_ZPchr0006g41720 [Zizania palustris]